MPLLRHFDLVLLASAAVVFAAADLPMLGYAAAAGAWLLSTGLQFLADRRIADSIAHGRRRNAMGFTAAAGLGRVWLITLIVLLVGLTDRESGLAAAVLSAILFTVFMFTKIAIEVFGPEAQGEAREVAGK